MQELIVYDDSIKKSEVIADIIGEMGFADVVVKKKRLEEFFHENITELFPNAMWRKVSSVYDYNELLEYLEKQAKEDIKVLHCFSNYIVSDASKVALTYKKLKYIDDAYRVMQGDKVSAIMFPSVRDYAEFCKSILMGQRTDDVVKSIKEFMTIEGLVDIGIIGNFIQCITGNFDSRYFNSLKGNEYTLVKSSTNKKKIKAEYMFYHLLPEDMKFWFVMPFNYTENTDLASYTMERMHMTDLAIKWVHGSMDVDEFGELMDKYFFFFQCRHKKECSAEEYQKITDALYIDKVKERISDLKKFPEFQKINAMLHASSTVDIDALVDKYLELKEKIESRVQFKNELVIGHGDPCFANALYNKSTKTLKFIDPKGALTEDELWTNAYYDVAKLSHSVCGRYDFFNNALFDIRINELFSYDLEISFDNSVYREIFKQKVEENGFDYLAVRIYEASLFLSMLPLHIDNPHKVFGFILNVDNILKEIEKDV